MNEDIIYRLRKRAEIRRQIPGRKSVMENKPDRISDLLEEAANVIQTLSCPYRIHSIYLHTPTDVSGKWVKREEVLKALELLAKSINDTNGHSDQEQTNHHPYDGHRSHHHEDNGL